jgi:hypothetical protein
MAAWFKITWKEFVAAGEVVCPLCHLPETEGRHSDECHCWDKNTKVRKRNRSKKLKSLLKLFKPPHISFSTI